ncbi:MAG: PucR family transcriptional regulator ligand-binding domain-containing protein [Anaerolineales bacterium]|nr:PucR family transcriptional regulator ligand-binding domain-containing protein [Anaerolineales bacterium]
MLTVNHALAMPVFASARLVAGQAGLENEIRWVHVVDMPDTNYAWQRKGILLLTTGYGLYENPGRQAALIPKLASEGFAGLVLAVGHYFDAMPAIMKEQADVHQFPIIEVSSDLLFIEVTEAILGHIVNNQYQLLQQSTRINEALTRLVLEDANLDDLAKTLAQLLQRSITIESPSFRILASAQVGRVDDARRRSVENGRTTPDIARYLLDVGIYEKLLARKRPLRIRPIPDLGAVMERFVAPIIVDLEIHGYIWIISGGTPLTELDELAISHCATVAALILFKDKALREAQDALRGDFFDRLLRGDNDLIGSYEQLRQINYHIDKPHQVLLAHAPFPPGANRSSLVKDIESRLDIKNLNPLTVWREGDLLILLESESAEVGKQVAQELVTRLSHPAQPLLVGVAGPCEPLRQDADGIRRIYEQAREVVTINLQMGQQEGVVVFDDLGLLHWLYYLPVEQWPENVYLTYIDTLVDYDAKRSTSLMETLEQYLDHGGALVDAAQALDIHRNTLLHRLERIEQLCNIDLRTPTHRLNLHVALKSYRLRQSK